MYLHLGVWRNGVDFEPLAAQPLLELAQPILNTNNHNSTTTQCRVHECVNIYNIFVRAYVHVHVYLFMCTRAHVQTPTMLRLTTDKSYM